MDFVLRIFFSGLIAFVPSTDGTELTVLLIDTPHEYAMADGSTLAHHKPLLLARAAGCEGACRTADDDAIAAFLFANETPAEAQDALNAALQGGGAWQLSGAELSLHGPDEPLTIRTGTRAVNADGSPSAVPTTIAQREDFSWIASVSELAPATQGYRGTLATDPNPGPTVAARLKLRSGKVITHSVVRIDGKARAVHFRKPTGEAPEAPFAQSLANWAEAKIRVSGDLEIVDQSFADPTKRRSMKLRPMSNGTVELALLNLPPYEIPAADAPPPSPQPGQHFQIYYELTENPPPLADRLVPHQPLSPLPSDPQYDWAALHPRNVLWSDLLEQLGLSPRGKGPYEMSLCPITRD